MVSQSQHHQQQQHHQNEMNARLSHVEQRVGIHEAVCSERYKAILKRLERTEIIHWTVAGAIIAALVTVVARQLHLM